MLSPTLPDSATDVSVTLLDYDGKYPSLCGGTLILEIGGDVFVLSKVLRPPCVSNGKWAFRDDTAIHIPSRVRLYEVEVLRQVQDLLGNSCCGGCK